MFHFTAVEKLAVRSNLARRRNNLGAKLGWGLAGYLHRPSMYITRYTSVHNVCFSLTCDTIHKGGEHLNLIISSGHDITVLCPLSYVTTARVHAAAKP